jgi:hypothetical protein
MARILTAENAQMHTAAVTIRTLTIEKRQVTLSVFRQLIEEDIFDWNTLALRGVGWGHVRHAIDEPPDTAINLVWQRGTELRRCITYRRVRPREEYSPRGLHYRLPASDRERILKKTPVD